MRTRSRRGLGDEEPAAEGAAAAARTPKRRRQAPAAAAATTTPSPETKKPKVLSSVSTPPPKAGKSKGASVGELKGSSRSRESKTRAGSAGKAVEDQSSLNARPGAAAADKPVVAAPKGRCVSGRDWKARNQSQRCVFGCLGAAAVTCARVLVFFVPDHHRGYWCCCRRCFICLLDIDRISL